MWAGLVFADGGVMSVWKLSSLRGVAWLLACGSGHRRECNEMQPTATLLRRDATAGDVGLASRGEEWRSQAHADSTFMVAVLRGRLAVRSGGDLSGDRTPLHSILAMASVYSALWIPSSALSGLLVGLAEPYNAVLVLRKFFHRSNHGGDRFRPDGVGGGGMSETLTWLRKNVSKTSTANNSDVAGRVGFGAPAFAMAA
jgi:hypothetical protein